MTALEKPQIYLITPPEFELPAMQNQLAEILDATDIACLRLSMATTDENAISRAADGLREICHARDVAIVIDQHYRMVSRLGLDGVHLNFNTRLLRDVRKDLGSDAIVGAFCGTSRHDGLSAGEAGADYISFGPVTASALGDGKIVETEVFEWWSQMIEVPVVAEGGLRPAEIKALAPHTDFFAIGPEIWQHDDPKSALMALVFDL